MLLCVAAHKSLYGWLPIMLSGVCLARVFPAERRVVVVGCAHNQSASRKAMRLSGGWYRPGGVPIVRRCGEQKQSFRAPRGRVQRSQPHEPAG